MTSKVLLTGKVRRWGNSYVLVLPPILRNAMEIVEGDYLCLRVHLPYATFCKWPRVEVPRLAEIAKEDRPPLNPESLRDARAKDSKTQPTD